VLSVGAVLHIESDHPDANDTSQYRIVAKGGSKVDCGWLEEFGFRATFSAGALERADALLAVTQANAVGWHQDGRYHGPNRPRAYTFKRTTPPFLLSQRMAALVSERKPISLHFYDFLDDGRPLRLAFSALITSAILVDGVKLKFGVVRYKGEEDSVLEVLEGTRLVRLISRDLRIFHMELKRIWTAGATR
jgi:hypothetical protein